MKPLISRAQRSVMRVAIPLARYLHLPREQPRALKSRHYGRRVKQPPGALRYPQAATHGGAVATVVMGR